MQASLKQLLTFYIFKTFRMFALCQNMGENRQLQLLASVNSTLLTV